MRRGEDRAGEGLRRRSVLLVRHRHLGVLPRGIRNFQGDPGGIPFCGLDRAGGGDRIMRLLGRHGLQNPQVRKRREHSHDGHRRLRPHRELHPHGQDPVRGRHVYSHTEEGRRGEVQDRNAVHRGRLFRDIGRVSGRRVGRDRVRGAGQD